MKKLLICLAITAFTFACSSDNNSGGNGGKITAKIDGVVKTFSVVLVTPHEETEGNETFTELSVIAASSKDFETAETISFTVDKGDTGTEVVSDFSYSSATESYYSDGAFTINVQANGNDKKLKGIFSGSLESFGSAAPAVVTDGSFNLAY